jgi:glutamate-5-semialdehyde dehydrogenase
MNAPAARSRAEADAVVAELGRAARAASAELAAAPAERRDDALRAAAGAVRGAAARILEANGTDRRRAEAHGVQGALLDRLTLDADRVEAVAAGLEAVADLPDPLGRELARWQRPNGLDMARVSVPIGVIGVIYEARPNVTADAAALCI